jgi:ATP/maltotriose-dependent transcriptional regulator MalT
LASLDVEGVELQPGALECVALPCAVIARRLLGAPLKLNVTISLGGPSQDVFVGRRAELARLGEIVERVRQGQPWLVVVEGESGVGKTALARRFVASFPDLKVLWARSDPAESDLDYGLVEQLVRRVDAGSVPRHPLLSSDMGTSSPFAVGAQLLALIGDLQADGPVALVIDDVQWGDRRSVEALSFMLRRLSVDPVLVMVLVRGGRDQLDDPARRMLLSVDQRQQVWLSGLSLDDVAPLADALGAPSLDAAAIQRLHQQTGGHTLYLQTVLSATDGLDRLEETTSAVPASLAAAIGDQLAVLSAPTRSLLEMMAVVNVPTPLARIGGAAGVDDPSATIEPAVRAGLVNMDLHELSRPVAIRHALQREAIYAAMTSAGRRDLHARAIAIADDASAWAHRVASLDRPDEILAAELEDLAGEEAAGGRLALAATHLQWASDISPVRADSERRLLTAALHLMLAEEARGFALRPAVEATAPCPLRSCVLGTMAFSSGQLGEAELRFSEALAIARADPDDQPLAAMIANRLAGTYTLLGDGEKVQTFGKWALGTGCLDAAAVSQTRTLIAIGASQRAGPRPALSELEHLDPDPGRIELIDVDALSFRGVFRLLAGDLRPAVDDMTASLRMVRRGATITLGLRVYSYLALAQYLAGAWDDVLLTSEQGFSAAALHARHYDLPLLHLAATCVPAGRGVVADAERHAALAEDIAASLDYGQERLYAAMARAVVFQAAGDHVGMAEALGRWRDDDALDDRSRMYSVLWRPLLVEGLIGSGRSEEAAILLKRLLADSGQVTYLQPGLAWLQGWLAEQQGRPEHAKQVYQSAEATASSASPWYTARLLLAHGRLLRRTGRRRPGVERLRRARDLYSALRAGPFIAATDEELAACGLPQPPPERRSILDMTGRETEVAHLIEQGMTNAEIATELFVTPKAVEYHLGNIYAKLGLKGRQQLRRFLTDSRRAASA